MIIKTIFFDLGEVVLTNDWHYESPEKFAEYEAYFGITYNQMEKGWNKAWPLFQIGKISEKEFWRLFLLEAGAKKIDTKHAAFLWRKYQNETPGMISLLKKLGSLYTLAVLSNTGKEWLDFKREKFKLDNYFKGYIASAYVGIAKPDPKIYHYALRKMKTTPQESLFIDDTQKVLLSAKTVGMNTILFKNSDQLTSELKALLII
jgi:HAD superfamily hydrolase (TIGR01509 family)